MSQGMNIICPLFLTWEQVIVLAKKKKKVMYWIDFLFLSSFKNIFISDLERNIST